jgi:hypothetical protein
MSDAQQRDIRPNPDPTRLSADLIHREIDSLREFLESKINAESRITSIKFKERDKRSAQSAKDGKIAIDAAFSASKEAVGKNEAAVAEQFRQQGDLFRATTKATDDKVAAHENRLTAMESQKKGGDDNRAYIVAALGILIGIAGLAVAIFRR